MNVLIVEDEINAYEYLSKILKDIRPDAVIKAHEDSVQGALNYLSGHMNELDLIFLDIQLSDGLSFELFNHIHINRPVIFTTAYDQYALDAFKVYSVDYLLKPIHKNDLESAIKRFEEHYTSKQGSSTDADLLKMVQSLNKPKKNRCLVKRGGHYEYIDVEEILFVNSEESLTFLHTKDGKRHMYTKTVESLYSELNPDRFFQINRSQILHIDSIREVHPYLNQRMKVLVKSPDKSKIDFIVSRNRMTEFKNWLDQ